VKILWEKQVREPPLLEGAWEKPSTSDADGVAEEPTMLVKSSVQLAAMESPPRSGDTRGKPRASIEKDSTSLALRHSTFVNIFSNNSSRGIIGRSTK